MMNANANAIAGATDWPEHLAPREVPVYERNEILVRAEPDVVWSHLVRAARWPDWYPYSADVRLHQNATELALGVRFDWRTFDLRVHSQVREWEPHRRIAWDAKAIFTSVYHRWTLARWGDGFTHVVTEETERGLLPGLLRLYLRPQLRRQHETWLQHLKCLAEGFPGVQ